MATTTLRPTGDLSNLGGRTSGGSSSNLYAEVDESTLDTGDYIRGTFSGAGWSVRFEWTAPGFASGTTINSLTVYVVATYAIVSFSLDGTNTNQIGTVGSGTPTLISKEYTTNPFTSSAWTVSEVNDLDAYILTAAEDAKQSVRAYQIYIVVDYTEGDSTGNFFLLFDF